MKIGIAIALMATVDVARAVVGNEGKTCWLSVLSEYSGAKLTPSPKSAHQNILGAISIVGTVPIGPVGTGYTAGNSPTCFQSCEFYAPNYCETPWVTCSPGSTKKVKDFCPVACKDKCDPNPCKNGGICANGNCVCPGGCSGTYCEYCRK